MSVVVMGVDPGSRVTGLGVVAEDSGQVRLVAADCVRLRVDSPTSERLARLLEETRSWLERYAPSAVAVETVFTAKSAASALKLGQARGAILAACGLCGIPVFGYEPTVVKKTVTGFGRADKEQVRFMVGRIVAAPATWPLDAADALAVAVCHLNHGRLARLTPGQAQGLRL